MIWIWLQLQLAGVWSYIMHWGLGIGAIILLVGGAIFSTSIPLIGPYLEHLRRDLLWAAAAIALLLGGQWIGARDAINQCKAKQTVIEKIVVKTVEKAKKKVESKSGDPWESDK